MDPRRKRFDMDDQRRFAERSGDTSPIHMDPLAARRTQVGVPIVHGVHTLLWALNAVASELPSEPFRLKASFDRPVYLEETVEVSSTPREGGLRVRVEAGGAQVMSASISSKLADHSGVEVGGDAITPAGEDPVELDLGEMTSQRGRLRFATPSAAIGDHFPALAARCGADGVAALACMSTLVGMVCPGLHSILAGLDVDWTIGRAGAGDALAFRAVDVDERFRSVQMAVEGGGLAGLVDTFVRLPPTAQPTMEEVARRVAPGAYRGARVLVVGGSRGLGEVVAKLLGVGGAHTVITYAAGDVDAKRVAAEINAFGQGESEVRHLDVREDIAAQLDGWGQDFTHLYYFATSPIFIKRGAGYDAQTFNTFMRFYVTAFEALCSRLATKGARLAAFYPSSVAVEARPPGMTEYAMAKAAGEVLCMDMARHTPGLRIVVSRLPRTLTDQTATVRAAPASSALDVMAPIVADLQAPPG